MSGLTKRVRGATTPLGVDAADVRGGSRSAFLATPPQADVVERLLSAFTDEVAGEGDR